MWEIFPGKLLMYNVAELNVLRKRLTKYYVWIVMVDYLHEAVEL